MKKVFLIGLFTLIKLHLSAQFAGFDSHLTVGGALTTKDHVPFWLRSDQYGSVPLAGSSAIAIVGFARPYDSSKKLFDWGTSFEMRADMGYKIRPELIEGYLKARFGIFELRGGRSKDFMGLVDSTLSSGAFAISGNALGIPKVEIAIRDYYTIPFLSHLFAFKGNFAYGWVGDIPVNSHFVSHADTYFSQSSLYARFGKPGWKLKLHMGINHQVYWGSETSLFGPKYKLSPLKSYMYAVIGKTYFGSKVGNHIGSLDLGMEYDFSNIKLLIYRQSFYDEGALSRLANISDGLNGVSLTNKSPGSGRLKWRKFLVELFYSKDQAGYPWSKRTYSGDENYYNNFQYILGWSYKGMGLGNPFITPYLTTRKGQIRDPVEYFNNNRVIALYTGMEGSFDDYIFTTKLSYSFNYGTFGTSLWGYSTGGGFQPPIYGQFKEVRQFSAYVKMAKNIGRNLQVGLQGALDEGKLFDNSGALVVSLSKSF